MNVIRCKVALVGDSKVGKTNIASQLTKKNFNNTYQTTLGIEYSQYDIQIKDTNYTVQFHILDFTGFSTFRETINNLIKDCNFILLVYDLTNLESFQNIKLWKTMVDELNVKKNTVRYLIGNKNENPDKIKVDQASIDSIANNLKLKSYCVSAKMNTNLVELFQEMAKTHYDNYINFINKIKNLN
jgi:Ras-related protein Rab-1A